MGWGLYTQLLNSLIINGNRDCDLNTRKHCRRALSNTPPSVSCNIYLVDTSKLVLIIRAVPRFSTHFSVSRSSDETLCVVIDELHLNVFAIIGPSALKVWASSRPTFWRILFWEGISFRKNKIIDYNIKVSFLFSEKRTLEIYLLPHPRDSKQNVPPLWRQKKKSTFFSLIICNVTLSSEKNVQNGGTQPGPGGVSMSSHPFPPKRWFLVILHSLLTNTSRITVKDWNILVQHTWQCRFSC